MGLGKPAEGQQAGPRSKHATYWRKNVVDSQTLER